MLLRDPSAPMMTLAWIFSPLSSTAAGPAGQETPHLYKTPLVSTRSDSGEDCKILHLCHSLGGDSFMTSFILRSHEKLKNVEP